MTSVHRAHMQPPVLLLLSILLAAAAVAQAQPAAEWQLHLLNTTFAQQRGALCLDGSPPGAPPLPLQCHRGGVHAADLAWESGIVDFKSIGPSDHNNRNT